MNGMEDENFIRIFTPQLVQNFHIYFRLFSHSADIWSHFILVVMLSMTLDLACVIFQIDLVKKSQRILRDFNFVPLLTIYNIWILTGFQESKQQLIILVYLIDPIYGIQLYYFRILLLWINGNWKLRRYDAMFVWIELATTVHSIAKIFHFDDSEHPATTLLSWIWNFHFEFGKIFTSKLNKAAEHRLRSAWLALRSWELLELFTLLFQNKLCICRTTWNVINSYDKTFCQ